MSSGGRKMHSKTVWPSSRSAPLPRYVKKIGRGRFEYKGVLFKSGSVTPVTKEVHDYLISLTDRHQRPRYFVTFDPEGSPATEDGKAKPRLRRRGPGAGSIIKNAEAAAAADGGGEGNLETV